MTKEEKKKLKEEKKRLKLEKKAQKKRLREERKSEKHKRGSDAERTPVSRAAETDAVTKTNPRTGTSGGETQIKDRERPRNYHISKRDDGKWQVKFAKGERALKLFDTQSEAIAFAKEKAENQDGSITIHKKDGKIRKQRY